jgi:glutamate dehydrogenase/leucine dehydrogenase
VAVQGLGNVGNPLVGFLLEKGVSHIVACDVDKGRVDRAKSQFAGQPVHARLALPGNNGEGDVMAEEVDILSPCAYGAVLNEHTVPRIKAGIVCGAANSQLADPRDDRLLASRGILYVPDFVCKWSRDHV